MIDFLSLPLIFSWWETVEFVLFILVQPMDS